MNRYLKYSLYGFYPIIVIVYFLMMFNINLNSILVLPVIFLVTIYSLKAIMSGKSNNGGIKSLVSFFLIYVIVSVILYAFSDRPLSCYVGMLRQFVFPMLFFYLGLSRYDTSDGFYKWYIYSSIFALGVGMILYFSAPDFYTTFMYESRTNTWHDDSVGINQGNIMEFTRFSSFWGTSYAVSYMALPAACVAFAMIVHREKQNNYYILLISFFVSVLSAILCQQRISMAFTLLYFILFAFVGIKTKNREFTVLSYVMIAVFTGAIIYLATDERMSIILQQLVGRMDAFSFGDAMKEGRTDQISLVLNDCKDLVFGDGLGTESGFSLEQGYAGVTDCEFIRILVEHGIIGLGVFLLIVIRTLFHGYKYKSFFTAELCIVAYFFAACIGSNALSIMFFFSPIFWYSIGRIWNVDYLNRLINERR